MIIRLLPLEDEVVRLKFNMDEINLWAQLTFLWFFQNFQDGVMIIITELQRRPLFILDLNTMSFVIILKKELLMLCAKSSEYEDFNNLDECSIVGAVVL